MFWEYLVYPKLIENYEYRRSPTKTPYSSFDNTSSLALVASLLLAGQVVIQPLLSQQQLLSQRLAKTIGGLPVPRQDHVQAIVNMVLDMQEAINQFNSETDSNCNIRIGINTRPVVAGVIGIKKFSLSTIYGETA